MDFQYANEFDYMVGIDAFPPYIYKTKFDFKFDTFRDKVDQYLKDSKKLSTRLRAGDPEDGDAITGVHFNNHCENCYAFDDIKIWDVPHNWKEFEDFFNFVELTTPFLMGEWFECYTTHKMHVSQSWINVHRKDGWTTPHHHQNATISIAAYLDVPENSGNFLVENPLRPYKCSEPLAENYNFWGPIEVETGDVLFFPGWLTHKTEKNKTDNPRYVLSTNIQCMPTHPAFPDWGYEGRK